MLALLLLMIHSQSPSPIHLKHLSAAKSAGWGQAIFPWSLPWNIPGEVILGSYFSHIHVFHFRQLKRAGLWKCILTRGRTDIVQFQLPSMHSCTPAIFSLFHLMAHWQGAKIVKEHYQFFLQLTRHTTLLVGRGFTFPNAHTNKWPSSQLSRHTL